MNFKSILLAVAFFASMQVCPENANAQSEKYHKSFFVGEEGIQYFIKPIELKGIENQKESLLVDFTFRSLDKAEQGVAVNFSFLGNRFYKHVDRAVISNEKTAVELSDIKLMFNEKSGKYIETRMSCKSSLNELILLFANPKWKFTIEHNNDKKEFEISRKNKKAVSSLDQEVFLFLKN